MYGSGLLAGDAMDEEAGVGVGGEGGGGGGGGGSMSPSSNTSVRVLVRGHAGKIRRLAAHPYRYVAG